MTVQKMGSRFPQLFSHCPVWVWNWFLSLKRMWLTLPQQNTPKSSVVPGGHSWSQDCGEVNTGELGSPAVPKLHILRYSEVFKDEVMWHLLIWSCGPCCGDIQLQVGSDGLGDLTHLQ